MTERRAGRRPSLALLLLTVVALGFGCASAKVTEINRQAPENVPPPDRVLVHDIAATATDLPADSVLQPHLADTDRESPELAVKPLPLRRAAYRLARAGHQM